MPKLPRYYVAQSASGNWVVCDRRKIKMHGDVVNGYPTRIQARRRAEELNKEDRQERTVDTQTGAGETI